MRESQKPKRQPTAVARRVVAELMPLEPCHCQVVTIENSLPTGGAERVEGVPIGRELRVAVSEILKEGQPQFTHVSLLLVHVGLLGKPRVPREGTEGIEQTRYHASDDLLEQVLARVGQAMRRRDQLVRQAGSGAAFILWGVALEDARAISERVYQQVDLLQAATIVPPLHHEAEILLGTGSICRAEATAEDLLASASRSVQRLNLRPALTTSLWALPVGETIEQVGSGGVYRPKVPFMQLPERLAPRLSRLIPHDLACHLQCVPVGRNHQSLTVALLDPANESTLNTLQALTGLTIYPVACDPEALHQLLATSW